MSIDDIDRTELNEAFAAPVIPVCREVRIDPYDDRFNAHGGAIALGHPFGVTGARINVHASQRARRGSHSLRVRQIRRRPCPQIVIYGTIKGKQAVKDAARVLGFPYVKTAELCARLLIVLLLIPMLGACTNHRVTRPSRSEAKDQRLRSSSRTVWRNLDFSQTPMKLQHVVRVQNGPGRKQLDYHRFAIHLSTANLRAPARRPSCPMPLTLRVD